MCQCTVHAGVKRWLTNKELVWKTNLKGILHILFFFLTTQHSLVGERNGNALQYSCLENPMDRGAWCVTVHGVAESQTQLSDSMYVSCGIFVPWPRIELRPRTKKLWSSNHWTTKEFPRHSVFDWEFISTVTYRRQIVGTKVYPLTSQVLTPGNM